MAKYSFEFKKKIVLDYLDGKGGAQYLSKKYELGSHSQLFKWINAYKEFGDEGLICSRKKNKIFFRKENFCCKVISIKCDFISRLSDSRRYKQSKYDL
ncbi:transposase [Lactobacillus iners]|uniref:transposase n=1 Tax=Lactobacillus iners TaxID=147802 RepID=UPI00254F18EE|nr:transposase [Lactobacillus iners]MCT7716558.1 transposase [Lactobacillus iners]MDK7226990.1 transposase [Lactobacillus iners]